MIYQEPHLTQNNVLFNILLIYRYEKQKMPLYDFRGRFYVYLVCWRYQHGFAMPCLSFPSKITKKMHYQITSLPDKITFMKMHLKSISSLLENPHVFSQFAVIVIKICPLIVRHAYLKILDMVWGKTAYIRSKKAKDNEAFEWRFLLFCFM